MEQQLEGKTLLVVAGPSGAGKTVLINQYRSGTLASELARLLPPGGEAWPQIGANDCMKRGVRLERILPRTWTDPGGVVHYDTAYIHRFGLARYEEDPGTEVFRRAGRIIAISIAPSAAQLREQFARRRDSIRGKKKTSHLVWKDHVRGPIERALNRLRGVEAKDTQDLYDDAEWVSRCYEAWTRYISGLVASKPGSRHVVLEPATDAPGEHTFHVVSIA